MIRDIIDNNDNAQPNDRTMEVLHREFPQCFNAEGKFDMTRLQELLQDKVDLVKEGCGFNFLGKNYASLLSSMDTTTVLVPDTEHNEKPENKDSQNVYISGDNLDALKHLVKSYSGKVKCIYIDPPYNTGKDDFAYNDKFNFTAEELEEKLSISEEQAQRIFAMTTRGAASHAAWLTFMMPRLQYAKDLLSDDGVIFISIDDNEQANLKLLCDYVFGEENCIGQIIWKNATDNNPTQIACEHEYVICYTRDIENVASEWKSDNSAIKDILVAKGKELVESYKGEKLQEEWKLWYKEHKSQLGVLNDYKFIDEGGVYTGSRSVHNPGKNGYY
ncbi:MAG: site-specific DNA-methyltransferase [Prevotellaceae bacterium]|nr:site-specific DNA-methyltransferase [Prevotellaceae bacterium]